MINSGEKTNAGVPGVTGTEMTTPIPAATRGLALMLGLDPRAAGLAIVVDLMLFGGDVISAGALIPASLFAAAGLGFIIYRIQMAWRGDTHQNAMVKALSVALLTALPGPVTPFFAVPAGILGLVRELRNK